MEKLKQLPLIYKRIIKLMAIRKTNNNNQEKMTTDKLKYEDDTTEYQKLDQDNTNNNKHIRTDKEGKWIVTKIHQEKNIAIYNEINIKEGTR